MAIGRAPSTFLHAQHSIEVISAGTQTGPEGTPPSPARHWSMPRRKQAERSMFGRGVGRQDEGDVCHVDKVMNLTAKVFIKPVSSSNIEGSALQVNECTTHYSRHCSASSLGQPHR